MPEAFNDGVGACWRVPGESLRREVEDVSTENTPTQPEEAQAPVPTPEEEVTPGGPEPGLVWKATVKEIGQEEVLVSLDGGATGSFPVREAKAADKSWMVEAGDEIEVLLDVERGGQWLVSMEKAEKLRVWDRLVSLAKEKAIVEGVITRPVRGGLSVDIGVRAFLPGRESGIRRADARRAMGRRVSCQIQRFDRKKGEVVLTRKAIAEKEEARFKADAYAKLSMDQIIEARVTSVTKFGAFMDLGGVEGLLHVSEMSWDRNVQPSKLVSVGDVFEVKIVEINPERDRVGLSRKSLLANPWAEFAEANPAGTRLQGTVTSIADFGAFVRVAEGVEGLVHISELSWDRDVKDPRAVLNKGDEVEVLIKEYNLDSQRLSLSIKRLGPDPWTQALSNINVGDKITGKITSVADFGVFVEVVAGVEGLVHVSDMSWTDRVEKPGDFREFNQGDELEVMVLELNADRRRISLGIKQLDQDPWEAAGSELKKGGTLTVTISRIAEFGAFATIVPGLEGLIHVSELATDRVERVDDAVKVGQEVKVRVLSAERKNRKVSLSIKAHLIGEGEGMSSYEEEGTAGTSLGALLAARGLVEDSGASEEADAAEDGADDAASEEVAADAPAEAAAGDAGEAAGEAASEEASSGDDAAAADSSEGDASEEGAAGEDAKDA